MRMIGCVLAGLLHGGSAIASPLRIEPWPLPVAAHAAQPQLVPLPKGVLLSWIEPRSGTHRLRYALDAGSGFGTTRTAAEGARWFVNWADVPAMSALPDGRMAAFVLRKSADAPYAYDLLLTGSDDGETWSTPAPVHDDGTPTEHGFASLWPWSADQFAIAWLDGRHTSSGGHDGHTGHGAGAGAMALRAAVFDSDGKQAEWELDARVCDCCQTDVATTSQGPVLVYRDRGQDEIRDIEIVRWRDGAWTSPRLVHADRWHMPACPVNGPAVAARDDDVYVAWYTVVGDEPRVRIAHSRDDGAHFSAPIELSRGEAAMGRVDVAVDDAAVAVIWLDEDAKRQSLWLARFPRVLSGAGERIRIATLPRGRGTGFPRIALADGVAHVVWTDIVDKQPRLRGAKVLSKP
jgi:hypothetical protein